MSAELTPNAQERSGAHFEKHLDIESRRARGSHNSPLELHNGPTLCRAVQSRRTSPHAQRPNPITSGPSPQSVWSSCYGPSKLTSTATNGGTRGYSPAVAQHILHPELACVPSLNLRNVQQNMRQASARNTNSYAEKLDSSAYHTFSERSARQSYPGDMPGYGDPYSAR